jgi:O-antigen/teichoic acid export membrane protein
MLFGRELLALLFGAEYAGGGTALTILAGGQLFNAAMGSIGILLNMTGFERDSTKGVALAAIVNGGLCMILIPAWGSTGAATAMTASLLVWNIVLAFFLWRRTGLHATALGRIRR